MDNKKETTIKVRFDAPTVHLMEHAGSLLGLDKSKFIRQSVRANAEQVIAEHEQTIFGKTDWETFFDLLDNPRQPSERMIKATKKYRAIVGG
jgi:uncharacterized protein (DUF1778 family)